ncbi:MULTISPECIES: RNase adapter RapZ [Desulfosediminicola]|uniref:RapZ C-terminal domain-containing protein n=1 Tax=Desulfosediminicola TaxID=2886823 RepID=UPI0010ABFDDB|nr:RNase adapter RapZ [Desulfosediminicola ganghwensis]
MGGESTTEEFELTIFSFGFKYGSPGDDATMVWDVRFLPNPYWQKAMRDRNGLEKDVASFVLESVSGSSFFEKLLPMIEFLIEQNRQAGKAEMKVAIGCTGGHHRSVAVVERLAEELAGEKLLKLHVYHRDIKKE